MRRADNLTTFMCRLSCNLGASTSWNPQRLSKRPVIELPYLYCLDIMPRSMYCHKLWWTGALVWGLTVCLYRFLTSAVDEGGDWLSGVHLALSAVPFMADPVQHSHWTGQSYCCIGVSSL